MCSAQCTPRSLYRCVLQLAQLPERVAAPVRLLMQPAGCCGVSELVSGVVETAALLGLQLPPVNAPLLLRRAAADLMLPPVGTAHLPKTIPCYTLPPNCSITSAG